jgi:hypothetical protein
MTPRNQRAVAVNIVVGNHASHRGIGEILYSLYAFLSRLSKYYTVTVSFDLVPDKVNVLIDEFTVPGTSDYFRKIKTEHPSTKLVVIATEFITPVKLFGFHLSETFNYFDHWEDRRYGAAMAAHWLRLKSTAPYMHCRYKGFIDMLRLADLVIAVHPAIVEALAPLVPQMKHWVTGPVNLYPELDPKQIAADSRLKEWPTGFVLTGTLTSFRKRIIKRLLRAAAITGIQGPVFLHLPFDRSKGFNIYDGSIDFPFNRRVSEVDEDGRIMRSIDEIGSAQGCLYNLNPPQRANWPHSSPMRILRAILYGQIPIVTRRFGDHELEAVAKLWDSEAVDIEELGELWLEASLDRDRLIEQHIRAISKYNDIAKSRNREVDLSLRAL